jgi:hypothetical protein
MREIAGPHEDLLASQEGLCSMEIRGLSILRTRSSFSEDLVPALVFMAVKTTNSCPPVPLTDKNEATAFLYSSPRYQLYLGGHLLISATKKDL